MKIKAARFCFVACRAPTAVHSPLQMEAKVRSYRGEQKKKSVNISSRKKGNLARKDAGKTRERALAVAPLRLRYPHADKNCPPQQSVHYDKQYLYPHRLQQCGEPSSKKCEPGPFTIPLAPLFPSPPPARALGFP